MIEKIISSGQPGVPRAALDAALKLGISHGGWISKGRTTEDGPLPEQYDLQEMPDQNPSERTKKNIRESCGTLILTLGKAVKRVEFITKIANRYSKPHLHVDLETTPAFSAATRINDWIVDNGIRVLNVTGPSPSRHTELYQATLDLLQAVFFLNLTEANLSDPIHAQHTTQDTAGRTPPPQRIEDVVEVILNKMPLKDRTTMANLREEELPPLQLTLGLYIKRQLDRWHRSDAFIASCLAAAKEEGMDQTNLTMLVIKKLWRQLRATHRLRIVK